MNNLQLNDDLIAYLLKEREKDSTFKFGVRIQNNKNRLEQGYWFQGNGGYIWLSFYKKGDSRNKTKTIGLVFKIEDDGNITNWIEIVYKTETNPDTKRFYESAKRIVSEATNLPLLGKDIENPLTIFKLNGSYLENLEFFIKNIKPKIDELIISFELEKDFFYSESEFLKNITRINQFRNKKKTMTPLMDTLLQKKQNLNQILYGPPGTGKTYKLQQIIEDWNLKEKISTEIDYTSFVKNYTWWQVIGLALLEKENITVPELAKHPLIIAKLGSSSVKRLNTRLWSSLQHHTVDECENVKLAHRVGERVFYKEANSEWRLDSRTLFQIDFMPLVDAFEEFKKSDDTKKSKDYTFTTCHQSLTYEDFIEGIKPDLSRENLEDDEDEKSEKVVYEIRKGIFYNACEKASQKAGFINLKDCLEHTKDERKYLFEKALTENKIHVIFLDEINRCNVSSVFGELITLIEDDKRLGEKNEIADITLPYSQEEFGVPANLFIIGTMNTADRSVEALDAALRRRFSFEEMPPLYNLEELQNDIFGYKASEILKKINLRIEKLLDKDHKIGHSYLLNKDKNSIIDSFYKNIIPLLQEYFFGDYSKIGLVLGKGFVHLKESEGSDIFAKFHDVEDDFDNKNVYEIIDYRKYKLDQEINFSQAIQALMNK